MNLESRNQPIIGKIDSIPNKENYDLEDFPYEAKFNSFLENISSIKEISNEELNGKNFSYVKFSDLIKVYKLTFGTDALADTTMSYRLGQIAESGSYNNDLMVEKTFNAWEPKYYVNIKNKSLLREIFAHNDYSAINDIKDNVVELEMVYPPNNFSDDE